MHNNFDLRNEITEKFAILFDFYLPTREQFAPPYTSPDLVQKSLKWLVMGALTLSLLPTLDDIDVRRRSTYWIPITKFQWLCALGYADEGKMLDPCLKKLAWCGRRLEMLSESERRRTLPYEIHEVPLHAGLQAHSEADYRWCPGGWNLPKRRATSLPNTSTHLRSCRVGSYNEHCTPTWDTI